MPNPSKLDSLRQLPPAQLLFFLALFLFVSSYGGVWLYNRFLKSEEDHVRDLLAAAAQGANDRSPSSVTEVLAEDFKGSGGIDKDTAHRAMVYLLMQRYKRVEVTLEPRPVPVKLGPDKLTATAEFVVNARGKYDEESEWQVLNDAYGDNRKYKATLRKDPKLGWKVVRVEIEGRER